MSSASDENKEESEDSSRETGKDESVAGGVDEAEGRRRREQAELDLDDGSDEPAVGETGSGIGKAGETGAPTGTVARTSPSQADPGPEEKAADDSAVEGEVGEGAEEPGGEDGVLTADVEADHGHDPHHGDEHDEEHDPHHDHDHGEEYDGQHEHDPHYDYHNDHGYNPDYDHYQDYDSHWDGSDEGDGGGIIDIQVFLTNVERFRWFMLKSCAALVIGMVVCLVGGNRVMQVLEWPLRSVKENVRGEDSLVVLKMSENRSKRHLMPTNEFQKLFPGAGGTVQLQLAPVPYGDSEVLGFKAVPLRGKMASEALVDLHIYDPMGAFWVAFQVAFYGGFAVSAPFIFYFLGQFLLPFLGGEFVEVKRALGRWVAAAAALFFAGMAFCYFLLLRVSLYGSVGFAQWMSFGADEWNATNYLSFACLFTVAMGIGFQVPVVVLLLVRIGILDHQKLSKFRPYWVVLNLVGSAFITPDGSPVTMILMAAPLWVLYEISLLIAWKWSRDAARLEAEEAEEA